ncbi:MAG TPA: hypothetical protein VGO43_04090 [Pyrinomonadaceae bacterium]|jgi:hypothetical protein|nr:hypothetical protein [Pyrinomonadaceae bacterium]
MILEDDRSSAANAGTRRLGWLLFLSLWLAYGVAINSSNLEAFALQQAGVEAYVERGHLYVEGSSVERLKVRPGGDTFSYGDHIYPGKQPGQFMVGALAYASLVALGLSYPGNYLLTAALVTLLTGSLVTAAAAVAVFHAVRVLAGDGAGLFWPLLAALSYGLGSTAFAYSGIAWHDSLAAGFLSVALCLIFSLRRMQVKWRSVASFAAGAMLGLTLTTSMLPAPMVGVVAVFVLTMKDWRLIAFFGTGIAVGLASLLIYDFLCFGHPLLLPNVAGGYEDIWFNPSWNNFVDKVFFYARMITLYTPIVWVGLLGLALFPRRLRHLQVLLAFMLAAHATYVLNIEATGTCQWGPRYMLPAMPLVCIGFAGFTRLGWSWMGRTAALAAAGCTLSSGFFNFIGAAHGAMLCDFPGWAVGTYLAATVRGEGRVYPLAAWLALPMFASAVLLVREAVILARVRTVT